VLVVDASVAVAASLAADGWSIFHAEDPVSPPLVLSESCSVLHEARWRGEITKELADQALERLLSAPLRIQALDDPRMAWAIAEELGWAKTYDAEYVALARALGCRLVTLDARLRRGAGRLVKMIDPVDL